MRKLKSVESGIFLGAVILIFFVLVCPTYLNAQDIPDSEYRARRTNLLNLMNDGSAVVLRSAEIKIRNGDASYRYRQESNFLYLSGVNESDCYLLLTKQKIQIAGKKVRFILFKPGIIKDTVFSDSEALLNNSKFKEIFHNLIPDLNTIYTVHADPQYTYDWLNERVVFGDRENRKYFELKHPVIKIKELTPVISVLREIKSQSEISLVRKAIRITDSALRRAAIICKPGAWEYEMRAGIESEMMKNGCESPAFPSIIGSGKNSLILHYDKDNKRMESGDVVVIDIGAEYKGYAADITRTFPVSGNFSNAQKEIYNIVLEAQKKIIEIIKPGVTFYELNEKALNVFAGRGMRNYMPHGVSHPVGLDVHDLSSSDTLKAGMIITVEPGLYFPVNDTAFGGKFSGTGIRIEDDILVTEKGRKILSGFIPKEIPDLERLFSEDNK